MRSRLRFLGKAMGVGTVLWAAATLATATPVGALDAVDSAFGVGTLTRDSVSNLDWLDLGLTDSYSYASISALLGAGQMFEGFRVATAAEVNTLVANSGILGAAQGDAAQTAFDAFVGLLSPHVIDDLGGQGCVLVLQGIAEPGNSGSHTLAGVGLDRQPAAAGGCGPVLPGSPFVTQGPVALGLQIGDNTTVSDHNATSSITVSGIFLVRGFNTVPEPGSLPLLAMAAAAAMLTRRAAARPSRR